MAPRSSGGDRERYAVDYDWLWHRRDPTAAAILRVSVSHPTPQLAAHALERFLATLPTDAKGVQGHEGWAVFPVAGDPSATVSSIDIVSGGEDVSDGIQAGADAVFNALAQVDGIGLAWHQLAADAVPGTPAAAHTRSRTSQQELPLTPDEPVLDDEHV
ncbi:hypothetical protein [Actinomyces glycerinitolerans]|uniref:Uncharacterized protein n=1 Tax=Actinomyces glycerinitolerans TaxID=1892869 RepID=A0A1M4RYV2_9ACTO|nr:hypothetical protein [Actinomyces glycerinitolerans]SHE25111.1 Hypothetical protein ACGLYG10_1325 [Actinomyces glycerinitolerans]